MNSKYKIFLALCNSGSFSKTAQELGYSQSAISQAMKGLEDELGTVLLDRKREGLTLTEDGKQYMPYIRNIVIAQENLDMKKNEMMGLENQTIRIGTFTSVSRNILPQLLADFRKQYPNAKFELHQGEYDNIYEWLIQDEIDFAFMNPEGYDGIHADTIYHDSMVAVLPKNHPLAKKKSVSLKDLCHDPYILLDEGQHSVPLDAFHHYDLQPNVTYTIYDDYSILTMIAQQMGISILYRLVVAGFEENVAVRPIDEPIERTIALAYVNRDVMSHASRVFMDYIQNHIGQQLAKLETVK